MAQVTSRQELISHCLRRLGAPVIEINVATEQLEDKVDDALQVYQEFHDDATLRSYMQYQLTSTDVTNKYIPVDPNIIYISKLFPVSNTFFGSGGMFDLKYQLMLNDLAWLHQWSNGIAYFYQTQQYLEFLDMVLSGQPQVTFSRHEDRLYIHGEWWNGDLKENDYVVAEVIQILDPETNTSIYNDMFIKNYTTQLIKQQWGQNMSKFEGVQLPGGVTISGDKMKEEAEQELQRLKEEMRLEQELPVEFLIG